MKFLKIALVIWPLIAACGLTQGNMQSKQSTDLELRRIKRIAVLAPAVTPPAASAQNPLLGVPSEKTTDQRDAGDVLIRLVYSAMVAMPAWQIISDSEVKDVSESVAPSNDLTRLRKIGELVYADAVLTGRVLRYRERVGSELGIKSPASVAFVLDLVDVRRGDVVWSARFDETQKGLSESILSLGDIPERGIRWLTAEQLAQDGVRKAVNQLHQAIARTPAS
jgi:hypothetical protein